MPNAQPVEGRCNAKRHDGQYCANKPIIPPERGGNGRCKFHGGIAALYADTNLDKNKHGFHATLLANAFRDKSLKDVMFHISGKSDLTIEIQFWRTKIFEYHKIIQKNKGPIVIQKGQAIDYEALLARAQDVLTRMAARQHEMHPSDALDSDIRIQIEVMGGGAQIEEDPPLDLEGGAPKGKPMFEGLEAPANYEPPMDEDPLSDFGDDP